MRGEALIAREELKHRMHRIRHIRVAGFEHASVLHGHGMDATAAFVDRAGNERRAFVAKDPVVADPVKFPGRPATGLSEGSTFPLGHP